MHKEKRVSPRVPFETSVSILMSGTMISAKSKDISPGGIFISSRHIPCIGVEANIVFSINGTEYKVPGTIRWRTASGFGVQFGSIGAALTHAINQI